MSLERARPHQPRTRQTALQELVRVITTDPQIDRAWHSLRAGDREAAVLRALQRHFGGDALRVYVPRREESAGQRIERVIALWSPPACMTPEQIAAELGITTRRVRQIIGLHRMRKTLW